MTSFRLLRGKEIVEVARKCLQEGRSVKSPHFAQRSSQRGISDADIRQLLLSPSCRAEVTRPIPRRFQGYTAYNYEVAGEIDGRRLVVWFHVVSVQCEPVVIWGSAVWKED